MNKVYQEVVNPRNLFPKIPDFGAWLDLAEDVESLEATLKAFEKEEMYEECIVIKDKMDEWKK